MFLIKIFSVTALILTVQNVWTKYLPTELERINYDYDIEEVKDPDGSLNDTPTLVTVVVIKNNSPRTEQYESFEDSKDKFLKSFQNNKDDERIVPLPINIYDFIYFDNAIEGEMNSEQDNDTDYKEILRKKKKKKKKKKKCKKACLKAAKSVCEMVECSSKKKKAIAKSCLRQCKGDSDDYD